MCPFLFPFPACRGILYKTTARDMLKLRMFGGGGREGDLCY